MKKLAFLCVALLATGVTAATALGGGTPVRAPQCSAPTAMGGGAKVVANVTYTLKNDYDYDSGVAGNAWANDTINRHLQVFNLGNGTYCAVVNDTGSFLTFAGLSPGQLVRCSMVSAGITGQIKGGYTTTTFTGTLDLAPIYALTGNLGTFDKACTDAYTCTGVYPSYLSYISTISGDSLANWGWSYHTAKNGDWVNAASGNSGDITG
jgi:hypothetical protein